MTDVRSTALDKLFRPMTEFDKMTIPQLLGMGQVDLLRRILPHDLWAEIGIYLVEQQNAQRSKSVNECSPNDIAAAFENAIPHLGGEKLATIRYLIDESIGRSPGRLAQQAGLSVADVADDLDTLEEDINSIRLEHDSLESKIISLQERQEQFGESLDLLEGRIDLLEEFDRLDDRLDMISSSSPSRHRVEVGSDLLDDSLRELNNTIREFNGHTESESLSVPPGYRAYRIRCFVRKVGIGLGLGGVVTVLLLMCCRNLAANERQLELIANTALVASIVGGAGAAIAATSEP